MSSPPLSPPPSHGPSDPFEHRRRFFSRPVPPGYGEDWAEVLKQPAPTTRERTAAAMLVFCIAQLRLSIGAHLVKTVTAPLPVCPLPHRHNTAFLGLVAVSGEIVPCCSLARILGLADHVGGKEARTVILEERPGEWWAFPVDTVFGVNAGTLHDYSGEEVARRLEPEWSECVFHEDEQQPAEVLRPEVVFERMRRATA